MSFLQTLAQDGYAGALRADEKTRTTSYNPQKLTWYRLYDTDIVTQLDPLAVKLFLILANLITSTNLMTFRHADMAQLLGVTDKWIRKLMHDLTDAKAIAVYEQAHGRTPATYMISPWICTRCKTEELGGLYKAFRELTDLPADYDGHLDVHPILVERIKRDDKPTVTRILYADEEEASASLEVEADHITGGCARPAKISDFSITVPLDVRQGIDADMPFEGGR